MTYRSDESSDKEKDTNVQSTSTIDYTTVFQLIDSISQKLTNETPIFKQDLYADLLRYSAENRRNDLTKLLADQCIQNNIKIGGSMNEIDILTGYMLPREIVEQLARYKPGEKSWREKLSMVDLQRANRQQVEELYQEAKQDGKYPFSLQERLLDIYTRKKAIQQAFTLLHEITSNRNQVCFSLKI